MFDFAAAVDTLYHFVWDEFCDWYLELVKVRLYGEDEAQKAQAGGHARWLLAQIVRLLHPFLPFVTEEIAAQYGEAPLLERRIRCTTRRCWRRPTRPPWASCRPWSTRCAASAPRPRCRRARCSRPSSSPRAAARRRATRPTPPPSAPWRAPRCASTASPTPRRPWCWCPAGASKWRPPSTGPRRSPVSSSSSARSRPRSAAARRSSPTRASPAAPRRRWWPRSATSSPRYVADRDELAARLAQPARGLRRAP